MDFVLIWDVFYYGKALLEQHLGAQSGLQWEVSLFCHYHKNGKCIRKVISGLSSHRFPMQPFVTEVCEFCAGKRYQTNSSQG